MLNPMGCLDSPVEGQLIGATVKVHGWALLSGRPATSVEVYLNGELVSRSRRCVPRPDVMAAVDAPPGDGLVSGFEDIVAVPPGATDEVVVLVVRAVGMDGQAWHSEPIGLRRVAAPRWPR